MKNILTFNCCLNFILACDDFDKYELPETNSIPDATPPQAVALQCKVRKLIMTVGRTLFQWSISATTYAWDFGDGNTSSDYEPTNNLVMRELIRCR